jgi:PAS domain S-box-containing protein
LGLGSRLVVAFVIVIGIMVTTFSVFSLFSDFKSSRQQAGQKIGLAYKKLSRDNEALKASSEAFAKVVISSQSVMQAFGRKDRKATADALANVINEGHFNGFVSIVDERGNVFYSTETPAKSGYSAVKNNEAMQYMMQYPKHGKIFRGAAISNSTQSFTMCAILPIMEHSESLKGLVAINQPFSSEYLVGETTKFAIEEPQPVQGIDLLVFSNIAKKIIAITPGLAGGDGGPFVKELTNKGIGAIPRDAFSPVPNALTKVLVPLEPEISDKSFEKGGRFWCRQAYSGIKWPDRPEQELAIIMLSVPVPDLTGKFLTIFAVAGLFGGLALLVGFVLSQKIKQSVDEPLGFLIDRTEDIAEQKKKIPPLEGLSGEWLELGELIDTAVSTMRSTTHNLKQKVSRQNEEIEEKSKLVDASTTKIENLNRQISTQTRQLTEVSKQVNQATRQAIVVQHKLDAVMQSSTEGFLILDAYGNILSANPVFLNWVGCSEGEIAGRLCFDLVKQPGEARTRTIFGQAFARHGGDPNAVLNRFYPEAVVYNTREESKLVEVLAHLQPICGEDNTNIQGYVMVLRDKSLRTENAQLRQEIVVMLQDAIRSKLAQAEARWVSILPSSSTTMHPSVGQALADLHGQYEQLLHIVDSYLMMYGGFIPPPVIPKEPIVITRLVADCLEEVTPLARERQLLLDYKTVTGLPSISGNRDAVRGILVQVLHHLIIVTAAGGRVRVESAIRGDEMRITVSSSGPALPPVEIEDMFAGFVPGKHAEDTYSLRLSMYLARNNVERLGGKIWAESEAGRGTSIYFTLPAHIE